MRVERKKGRVNRTGPRVMLKLEIVNSRWSRAAMLMVLAGVLTKTRVGLSHKGTGGRLRTVMRELRDTMPGRRMG